jgi:hypothetical protein
MVTNGDSTDNILPPGKNMKFDESFNSFAFRGQRYTRIGRFEIEYQPGRWIPIFELESRCPTCGDTFTVTASRSQIRNRKLGRRCKPCRRLRLGPVAPSSTARAAALRNQRGRKALVRKSRKRGRQASVLRVSEPRQAPSQCRATHQAPSLPEMKPDDRRTLEWALFDAALEFRPTR